MADKYGNYELSFARGMWRVRDISGRKPRTIKTFINYDNAKRFFDWSKPIDERDYAKLKKQAQ